MDGHVQVASMARGRRFSAGYPSKSQKRKTEWSVYDNSGYVNVASGGATILSGLFFEDPGTLVRTRGMISVKAQSYAADIDIIGAFGLAIVSQEAFNVGVTAVPEPFTDSDWGGWMVIQAFAVHLQQVTNAGLLLGSWQFEIDSKAMRKVEPNSAVVVVAESSTGAFAIADTTRLLQMLH